jgi:hypothetical protein
MSWRTRRTNFAARQTTIPSMSDTRRLDHQRVQHRPSVRAFRACFQPLPASGEPCAGDTVGVAGQGFRGDEVGEVELCKLEH